MIVTSRSPFSGFGAISPPTPVAENADGSTVYQYADGSQVTIAAGEPAPNSDTPSVGATAAGNTPSGGTKKKTSNTAKYIAVGALVIGFSALAYGLLSKKGKKS